MGKCISKNPHTLTLTLSERDLANAKHILAKYAESSEYIAAFSVQDRDQTAENNNEHQEDEQTSCTCDTSAHADDCDGEEENNNNNDHVADNHHDSADNKKSHRNQLCKCFALSNTIANTNNNNNKNDKSNNGSNIADVDDSSDWGGASTVNNTDDNGHKQDMQQDKYCQHCASTNSRKYKQQCQFLQNTCLQSVDHCIPRKSYLMQKEQHSNLYYYYDGDDDEEGNDVVDVIAGTTSKAATMMGIATSVGAPAIYTTNAATTTPDDDDARENVIESKLFDDKYNVELNNINYCRGSNCNFDSCYSCSSAAGTTGTCTMTATTFCQSSQLHLSNNFANLANSHNNKMNNKKNKRNSNSNSNNNFYYTHTNNNNYYSDMPHYLAQLCLLQKYSEKHQNHQQHQQLNMKQNSYNSRHQRSQEDEQEEEAEQQHRILKEQHHVATTIRKAENNTVIDNCKRDITIQLCNSSNGNSNNNISSSSNSSSSNKTNKSNIFKQKYYKNKKQKQINSKSSKHKPTASQSLSNKNNDNSCDDLKEFCNNIELLKGQAESKKSSKKHQAQAAGVETMQTKGTAMSFGFRKNLNTTPKKLKKLIKGEHSKHNANSKKQDKCNNIVEDARGGGNYAQTPDDDNVMMGADGNSNNRTDTVIDTSTNNATESATLVTKDNNGNADLLNNVHFEKMGTAALNSIYTNAPTMENRNATTVLHSGGGASTLPGVINRFGFRNPSRPSSTDIMTRHSNDGHDNMENNNCGNVVKVPPKGVLVSNMKRRSKSAHAGRTTSSNESDTESSTAAPRSTHQKTITFNLKQNSTIEYDRRQFFEQPIAAGYLSGMPQHNIIHRPTPRVLAGTAPATATTYSKFTLQTVSLPKPEFAVPISIIATTPTTPGSSYASSPVTFSTAGSRRHPLTVAQSMHAPHYVQRIDAKAAKHMENSTRRTFSGSREISADSGIASMDMAMDSSSSSAVSAKSRRSTTSPKRSRSRPRNLQMVMNGRGRFEVKDLEDSLSSDGSSVVEPLALPKLPTENQTVPLPLSGLVRSNTVLSRETYELRNSAKNNKQADNAPSKTESKAMVDLAMRQNSEEDSESVNEEKLHMDRSATEKILKERQFKDINTCSSKTSSPGSSIMSSWCNGGESLAANDFSNLSISSSEDSNKREDNDDNEEKQTDILKSKDKDLKFALDINEDEDLMTLNTDVQISTISSLTETVALQSHNDETDKSVSLRCKEQPLEIIDLENCEKTERPRSLCGNLNETKFAEMALEGSTFLLDDETSPTDSLVSSTDSEAEAACKQKKHKLNAELQEKDIDEISPEFEMASPISPGTPTHASHSLSLSDCGNLIDDEIADQPALLCNQESQDDGRAESSTASRRDKTDTPTLMESLSSLRASMNSQTNRSRSALHQAMELSLRTPLSLRKAVMERAESLDTLSPCESICSDDLMMDFDVASSMDSIDRSLSIKSRSGSDLNKIDDTELFSELDRKGSDVMKELNSLLRSHSKKKNNSDRDITAHLPARATRLLNRSRLQQHYPILNNDGGESDSNKSPVAARRRTNTSASRASTASSSCNTNNSNSASSSLHRKHLQQHQQQHHNQQHHHHHHHHTNSLHHRDTHSSSDDLMLYDKSFRNAMIQDVLQFKKQLLRLRRILQENDECSTPTETINPFENDNGQLFSSCGLGSKLLDDIDLASLTSSITDDPMLELSDLRRQVVYLQGQVDDRDRTIRLQKNHIDELEAEKLKTKLGMPLLADGTVATVKECVNTATQTERTRPLAIGTEGLSRSKPEYTSFTTHFPAICNDATTLIQHRQHQSQMSNSQTRRHTIISTTLTNYNHQIAQQLPTTRRASIAWDNSSTQSSSSPSCYKPVKITLIGDPLKHWNSEDQSLHKMHNGIEAKKNFINNTQIKDNLKLFNNTKYTTTHYPPQHLQNIMMANESCSTANGGDSKNANLLLNCKTETDAGGGGGGGGGGCGGDAKRIAGVEELNELCGYAEIVAEKCSIKQKQQQHIRTQHRPQQHHTAQHQPTQHQSSQHLNHHSHHQHNNNLKPTVTIV